MNARHKVVDAARNFGSPEQAIVTRCEQSGLVLWVDQDGRIKAKGNRKTIEEWRHLIKRHEVGVIAVLTERPQPKVPAEHYEATLTEDYRELIFCIMELCELEKYSEDLRQRMLAAVTNVHPTQYAIECASFRLELLRARVAG